MLPPLTPVRHSALDSKNSATARIKTSPEEAFKALGKVLGFFLQQPNGFLDLREGVAIRRLMERLESLAKAEVGGRAR